MLLPRCRVCCSIVAATAPPARRRPRSRAWYRCAVAGRGRLILAALPCLLGSQDPGCPPPATTDEVLDVTVVAVEHATYSCGVTKSEQNGLSRCIGVFSGYCDLTLRARDGTSRSGRSTGEPVVIGAGWCDLPLGRYETTLCTSAGPLTCSVDVANGDSDIELYPVGSFPFPHRYRARSDSGDLVFDAKRAELAVGDRLRITLHRNRLPVPQLGSCDIAMVPPLVSARPAPHGCATCDSGEPDVPTMALVAFLLATWRRRRSR